MKKLKISVITPSLNTEKTIERAIKSVLKQDYQNWEHIIIDGASRDNTLEIIKKYKHIRLVSEKDKGQSDAMQKGFNLAKGDIIVYLNSDDYFLPGAFTSVIKSFNKGSDFVVGNILIKSKRLRANFINDPKVSHMEMLRHWEPNAFAHNPVGYFYKRQIQKEFPLNLRNDAKQDLEFLLDVSTKYKFTKIRKVLGVFMDGNNTKTAKEQSRLDFWQPSNFPFLQKHMKNLLFNEKMEYLRLQREGYSNLQLQMNRNNNYVCSNSIKALPKVSIIIPAYNCAKYIKRAVDSVLNQKLINYEIIIVDDKSTDNTLEVISKLYKNNSNVKIVKHKQNLNLGASRNTGIDNSNGDYLFFLDSDDYLLPNTLRYMLDIAKSYNYEVVACGINKVFDDKTIQKYRSFAFSSKGGIESLFHFSEYRIASVAWNKLYKASLIKDNNIRFITKYFHEDVGFTLNILMSCRNYIQIEDTFYQYFQNNKNKKSITLVEPTQLHLESYLKIVQTVTDFIMNHNLLKTEEGLFLSKQLIKSHLTNELLGKLSRYRSFKTQDVWEGELSELLKAEYGASGLVLSELITLLIDNFQSHSVFHDRIAYLESELADVSRSKGWKFIKKIRGLRYDLAKFLKSA